MTYYFDHWRNVEYVLRANGVQTTHRDVSTTSVQRYMSNHHVNRRSQAKSHRPILSKVKGVEEL